MTIFRSSFFYETLFSIEFGKEKVTITQENSTLANLSKDEKQPKEEPSYNYRYRFIKIVIIISN